MRTTCASLGVYGQPGADELEVLRLANEFRRELCGSYQREHEALIDLRNDQFPDLWQALVRLERAKARLYELERAARQLNSEVRDRNAVAARPGQPPREARRAIRAARTERKAAAQAVSTARRPWVETLVCGRTWWAARQDWKNVKSLALRRTLYQQVRWPRARSDYQRVLEEREAVSAAKAGRDPRPVTTRIHPRAIAAQGRLKMSFDLERRELGERYQALGLHSAIRGEITEASRPQRAEDAPGMRYRYGRDPQPRPWRKLTLQIAGGLTLDEALAGRCPSLRFSAWPANDTLDVEQQIGTAERPRRIHYRLKLHRPFPPDAVIQRWGLVVTDRPQVGDVPYPPRRWKRYATALFRTADAPPLGDGALTYTISWQERPDGLQVAEFRSPHVNERLVLPWTLLDRRMAVERQQPLADGLANALLERRGTSRSKRPGSLHGVAALDRYVSEHPADAEAYELLWRQLRALRQARRQARRAQQTIVDIYRTVTCRLRRLHAAIVLDPLDLAKIKRYNTRDLLRVDPMPGEARVRLFAAAPGKLQALLKQCGLASVPAAPEGVEVARETDVFASYVRNLGLRMAGGGAGRRRRSRRESGRHATK